MNILSAEKISKSYSEKILFNEISIGIARGEKIGLIGVNGTGKSTLLKVIAGVEPPDTGRIITGGGVKIEYLPQNPAFENGATVLEQIFKGGSPVMELLREYESVLHKLTEAPGDARAGKRLLELTQSMDSLQAWTVESEAKAILTRLRVLDFDSVVGTLSGGQKKRVAMAGALISPADLLILDEPTNHIDNDTVDWLERYLNSFRGALLMVTHDRYFLGRVCGRIIELDNGRLYSYRANYEKYLEMKAEREELEQASERKRRNLLRSELEWIRRGAKARSTKQKARIERFEKLSGEQMVSAGDRLEITAGASRLGKKIIELEHVGKGFPGVEPISDLSYLLLRDDRVGVIGPNGSGKSTLLRMIAGKLEPDRGRIIRGETVKIGFFSQEGEELDGSLSVIDCVRSVAEYITSGDGVISASQLLERFLFPPSMQWTPVAKLSGGEKRRLSLLRVLMGAPNILLLDEPTNDLDIQTLTVLESYLDEFPGAVVAVSHDRYFLDRVVDKIFLLEGDGTVKQFEGNYAFYSESLGREGAVPKNDRSGSEKAKAEESPENRRERPLKFTFREQKEFEQIDEIITGLENEINEIKLKIEGASSDFELLQSLLPMQEKLQGRLNEAMERWVYLNERAEEILKSREGSV